MNKLNLYLQEGYKSYVNTDKEAELVNKFMTLYTLTKSAQEKHEEANPKNLEKYRKAYRATLGALTKSGEVSTRKSRQLRKLCYEIVESTVDNSVPMPKMKARYKIDIPVIETTENYLKYTIDRTLTTVINDKSERSTYIDGTVWYKVWWDSMDNTHERSGDVKVDIRTVDQIYPQPGVQDYKQLEYIFERTKISTSKIYELYGRYVEPISEGNNIVDVVACYYLNDRHVVGLFMFTPHSLQVICNEEDWQIRKLRKCTACGTINPIDEHCRNCGNVKFKYETATTDVLSEELVEIYNPYEVGETDDPNSTEEKKVFATQGTEIPFYQIRQLPFVPRPAVSVVDSIYGISSVSMILEEQDAVNKVLTKAVDKTLKSGAVVTKPERMKMSDTDDTIKLLGVRTAEEAQMVNTKQIQADTTQDLTLGNILYDNAKSTSGITDSFQGKKDTTATSGKAKQYAAAQSAGRIESMRVMKKAAFAGVYELIFKYLLAFSDETRKFVRTLPDGTEEEMMWNKYMFLDKDKYGNIYYRDDFTFSTDTASILSQDREALWQETTNKFIQGAFGNPQDPRVLKIYWNTMEQLQYPLAKVALAGIKNGEQHLPPELEAAIMSNPELMQVIAQYLQQGQSGQGGARPNSGPKGNGATHSANVERTNERNRAANKQVITSNQQGGII